MTIQVEKNWLAKQMGISYSSLWRQLRLEKKIKNLEKKIRVVENLMDELPIDELETYQMSMILTWRYIYHMDAQAVIRVLGITKTTYYRRKNALIARAEKYLGNRG